MKMDLTWQKKVVLFFFVLLVFGQSELCRWQLSKKQKLELIEINGSSKRNKKDASENKEKKKRYNKKLIRSEKNRDQKFRLVLLSSLPTVIEKKLLALWNFFINLMIVLTVEKYISEQVDW